MKTPILVTTEYNNLEYFLSDGFVKLFATKKEAQQYIKGIDWRSKDVVRVQRRFENGWILARHLGIKDIAGVEFDVYKVACQLFTSGDDGKIRPTELESKKYLSK